MGQKPSVSSSWSNTFPGLLRQELTTESTATTSEWSRDGGLAEAGIDRLTSSSDESMTYCSNPIAQFILDTSLANKTQLTHHREAYTPTQIFSYLAYPFRPISPHMSLISMTPPSALGVLWDMTLPTVREQRSTSHAEKAGSK